MTTTMTARMTVRMIERMVRAVALACLITAGAGVPAVGQEDGGGALPGDTPIGTLTIVMIGEVPTPVYHVGFEASNTGRIAGGAGGGAGRPTLESIVVTRRPDELSAELFRAVVTGQHLQGARIEVYQPGTTNVQASYLLTDVLVTRLTGVGGVEAVAFDFGQIELSSNGQSFCFNVVTLLAC